MNPQVTEYLNGLPLSQQAICQNLREILLKLTPTLEEKWAWERPVYALNNKNIAYFVANKSHVNLGFEQGAHLNDPQGRLVGSGINMRHIKLRTLKDIDKTYFLSLLAEAIQRH